MQVTLVRFSYEDGFDETRMRKLAEGTRATFEDAPGLRFKAYAVNPVNREATNYCVWSDEHAARSFLTPQRLGRLGELYGTPPKVEFSTVVQLIENRR